MLPWPNLFQHASEICEKDKDINCQDCPDSGIPNGKIKAIQKGNHNLNQNIERLEV